MVEWSLTYTPALAALPLRTSGPSSSSACAASGKGFGDLVKQRQSKGKDQEIPILPRSPSRGFGADARKKKSAPPPSREAEVDEAPLHADPTLCSCGGGNSHLPYTQCCMPYHSGTAIVPDGLSLLRARYSAYARGIVGYIVNTTHPENPDFGDNLLANAQATCDQLRFYSLDILHYEPISNQESTVTFRVVYGRKKGGIKDRKVMEEKSYFVHEGDTWLFKDGETLKRT